MSTQGSIRKDDSGAWFFVVDVAGPRGVRAQLKRRGFATKKEAAAALSATITDQNRGAFIRPSRVTVRTFLVDEWLPAKIATLKPSTAATYAQYLRTYAVPYIGDLELSKVDGGVLNALYGQLLSDGRTGASGRTGGLAPKTVRNLHGMLHRAFADAVRWRRLTVNPCLSADQPRKNSAELGLWSAEQMRHYLDSVRDDRLHGAWCLLLTTGLRRGELLGLRWSDLDMAVGRATVRHTVTMVASQPESGTPKSVAGGRTISIDPATLSALRALRKLQAAERLLLGAAWLGDSDFVMTEPDGSAIHPQVLSRRFKAQAKSAGLPIIRFHDVRHSYATAALAAGVPVKVLSQRLGHADIGVTLRIYAHVMPGDDEAAAALAANAIFGIP